MTLAQVDLLPAHGTQWGGLLERLPHDIYHTPDYHGIPGFGQAGSPCLFAYGEGDRLFLWPYLLTPIAGTGGWHDVRSVYGYSGPLATAEPAFLARAWRALVDHWERQHVVSAFTRFHPLLGNGPLIESIGDAAAGVRAYGATVSIDLAMPLEGQFRRYNKKLRQEIRKAREAGLATIVDSGWRHSDAFVALYQETMSRRGSRPEYVIDRAWVDHFRARLAPHAQLFVTTGSDGAVAAAMIVLAYRPFVHCHLIGTAAAFAGESPSKLLLDDVRIWGTRNGYQTMHLGGGLGGREDSLFGFKRRFSPRTQPFHTGAWILNEPRYRELEAAHRARLAAAGIALADIPFFPAYRYTPHADAG